MLQWLQYIGEQASNLCPKSRKNTTKKTTSLCSFFQEKNVPPPPNHEILLTLYFMCLDSTKLYIGVVLCVQGQCYQMKVQIYGHLLPNKFSKIKFIKFWLKNHQKSGDNLTKSIRNSFPKISILAFLPSFQLESSGNLDACTKQTKNFTYRALSKRE